MVQPDRSTMVVTKVVFALELVIVVRRLADDMMMRGLIMHIRTSHPEGRMGGTCQQKEEVIVADEMLVRR